MTLLLAILFAGGLLGGVLAGLLGIGGGLIYVLVLGMAFDYLGVSSTELPQLTIANSFFAIFFASLAANLSLLRKQQFYWQPVLWVGLGSVLASLLTRRFIVQAPWFAREQFNTVIILLLFYMLYRVLRQSRLQPKKELELANILHPRAGLLSGLAAGFIAAISGLGGGLVLVPILHTVLKLNFKKARSISLGAMFFIALASTVANLLSQPAQPLGYGSLGYVVLPFGASLAGGVMLGAPLGLRISEAMTERSVSFIYAGFLVLFIAMKIREFIAN